MGFDKRAERAIQLIFEQRKLKPQAIMSMYAEEAVALNKLLKERGLKIPEDMALTSWEDSAIVLYNEPPLTTVYYPFWEIGFQGCNLLLNLLTGKKVPFSNQVPGRLIFRESCGCFPSKIENKIDPDLNGYKFLKIKNKSISNIELDSNDQIKDLQTQFMFFKHRELFQFFEQALKKKNAKIFLDWFKEEIKERRASITILEMIKNDFSLLYNKYLNLTSTEDNPKIFFEIFIKVMWQLNNWTENALGEQEKINSQFSAKINELGANLITAFNLEDIKKYLKNNLSFSGIDACYLYDLEIKEEKIEFNFLFGITGNKEYKKKTLN